MALSEKQQEPIWADVPFKLISETGQNSRPDIPKNHSARHCAFQMAMIHNTLIRAFNSVYNQALNVTAAPAPSPAADFLSYNQLIYEFLHHHHGIEEEVFFPLLEEMAGQPGLMDGNVEQHKAFESGLNVFKDYAFNTKPEDYDGAELIRILDSFGHILQVHLHDEIPSLLGLCVYDSDKVKAIWDKTEKAAIASLDTSRHGPLLFGCQDLSFQIDGRAAVFPNCPFFVPYLVRYVHERKYKPLWKFNPSSTLRTRRELTFVGSAKA